MRRLIHKLAVETTDGIRKTYNTPTPYTPGTLVPIINGCTQALGFIATEGTAVTFDDAPELGDVVSFFYTQA